jgi:hypothetical protein
MMRWFELFVSVLAALCAAALLAAIAEWLAWRLHLNDLAATSGWIAGCAIVGATLVLHNRFRASERFRLGGAVLLGTAVWQIVKWAIVSLEAGISHERALFARIGIEALILGSILFFAARWRRAS